MDLHNKKYLLSMEPSKQCLLVKPKEEEAMDLHDMEESRISSNILTDDAEQPDNIDEYPEEVHKEIKNYWHLIHTTRTTSDLLDHTYNYQWSAANTFPDHHTNAVKLYDKILKIFEVWHYNNVEQYHPMRNPDGGLFTEYVNTFMKLKLQPFEWEFFLFEHQS
uniref:Uncharacterized protein n=1 Tax=Romanomermis culicivorax TaxID=13658 RepID=A0A915KEX4_ROMCU